MKISAGATERFKSFAEIEAEYESKMTRTDKVLRWWHRYNILIISWMMIIMSFSMTGYLVYSSNHKTYVCQQHHGIMLGGACIQSDVIHEIKLD